MKIMILVVMFLLLGAFFIISENNLALGKEGNWSKLGSFYSLWFFNVFQNGKAVTGYVIHMDWLPDKNNSKV